MKCQGTRKDLSKLFSKFFSGFTCFLLLVLCVLMNSSALSVSRRGKVRPFLLSAEGQLENFVANIRNAPSNWRLPSRQWWGKSKAASICAWQGIYCNSAHQITSIEWDGLFLTGNISWAYIPQSLETLCVSYNNLSGSLEIPFFPPSLRSLRGSYNRFTHGIDLAALPEGHTLFWASRNSLSGTLDLTSLPPVLGQLNLCTNKFYGNIELAHLPRVVCFINLSENQLSGNVDLTELMCKPDVRVDLRKNAFSGYSPEFRPQNVFLSKIGIEKDDKLTY